MQRWSILVPAICTKEIKGLLLSLRTDIFFSHIDYKWEREDLSLIGKAEGWWYRDRRKISPHQQSVLPLLSFSCTPLPKEPCSTTLLGANLRNPDCRSGSSEEHQHMLIFTWQQPSRGRCPFPSHHPSDDWRADSCTVLSNTHSKTPAINFSHFSPNLPSSHTLPAHFTLPYSRLKPLHILLALFQLPWHNTVSPISNRAFPGMIPIGNLQFW